MDSYHKYRRSGMRQRTNIIPYLVLLLAAAGAAAVAFSPIGTQIRDSLILPVISIIRGTAEETPAPVTETMAETVPAATAEPTAEPLAKKTLTVSEKPFYLLQMGHYDNEKDASIVSAEIQSMGGGGYVYEQDGLYRMFAAAYTDAQSLQTVQAQIRRDGFVNEAFITDAKVLHITLEGQPEAVELMEEAASVVESVPMQLSDLTIRFDKGEADKAGAREALDSIQKSVSDALQSLQAIDLVETERILNTLKTYQNALSTFLDGYDTITQDYLAGSLKHLQIETIIAYTELFKESDTDG